MTMDWHISEEEALPLPDVAEPKPPTRPPAWLWAAVVVAVLLVGVLGAVVGRFWRARDAERLLHRELSEVILAETQAQAFGLFGDIERFAPADAPSVWRMAYSKLFYANMDAPEAWRSAYPTTSTWRPPDSPPQIKILSLSETGAEVRVQLAWVGRSAITEQRAYEWVNNTWHRTPWVERVTLPDTPITSPSAHYSLYATPTDLAALNGGAALFEPLEALRAQMDATWQPEYLNQNDSLAIRIEPRELYTLLIRNRPDEITLNSLEVGLADPNLPFSAEKQQLVLLCSLAATYRLNRLPLRATMGYPPDDGMAYNVIYHLLPQAEAYRLILDEREGAALRNLWRKSLAGGWFSPFDSPKRPELLNLPENGELYQQWLLTSRLLIAYLQVEHGITPGMVVRHVSQDPQRPLLAQVAALTGMAESDIEADVLRFATTME